jgi:hypothetical protein
VAVAEAEAAHGSTHNIPVKQVVVAAFAKRSPKTCNSVSSKLRQMKNRLRIVADLDRDKEVSQKNGKKP